MSGYSRPLRSAAVRLLAFVAEAVCGFYRRPLGWMALLVSSAFLTYGGGAAMFWLHAVLRGEAGPAIDNVHHWLLDSTLGFIALTPVLAIIVPLAALRASSDGRRPDSGYILATATVFTAFTGPGPLLHNLVAGAGTPLANLATRIFGENTAVAVRSMHAPSHSPVSEGLLQVLVGYPVYLLCTWLALRLIRFSVTATRHWRVATGTGRIHIGADAADAPAGMVGAPAAAVKQPQPANGVPSSPAAESPTSSVAPVR